MNHESGGRWMGQLFHGERKWRQVTICHDQFAAGSRDDRLKEGFGVQGGPVPSVLKNNPLARRKVKNQAALVGAGAGLHENRLGGQGVQTHGNQTDEQSNDRGESARP